MRELSNEELLALCAQEKAPPPAKAKHAQSWLPALLPKQMEVFNDSTDNLLVYGPRYTGKGWACGYHVVRHCWDHYNALALIVAKTKRQALTGGFLYKVGNEILPDFKANLEGFDYEGPVTTQEKDLIYRVKNRFGGWSTLQMMSIMHDHDCDRKIRGLEVSLCYCDEITLFETDKVYVSLRGTLKRRKYIPHEAQRFVATCNPAGPSHWVYKKFYEAPPDVAPFFRAIFLPITENPDPNAKAYVESLKRDNATDPIAYARDIEGRWVDRPSGNAIFGEHFDFNIHVRGDLKTREFLQPKPGLPITLGWDLGDANHAIAFLQDRTVGSRQVTVVFDEIVYTGKKITYDVLVPEVLARMEHWCAELDHAFAFIHVSDRSAFDRFRAVTGSYDHRQVQQISQIELDKRGGSYPHLAKPIRLLECPKPPGSVAARVKLLIGALARNDFYVSANCVRLIESFEKLTSKKDEPYQPERSEHLHIFDALTYPMYYTSLGGAVVVRPEGMAKPEFYQVGA